MFGSLRVCISHSIYSSKESHVGSAHAIVRVPSTCEHPLGPGLTAAIRTEEVEENGCIQRLDGVLTEVVIVSIDLVAAVVVRADGVGGHEARVSFRELL